MKKHQEEHATKFSREGPMTDRARNLLPHHPLHEFHLAHVRKNVLGFLQDETRDLRAEVQDKVSIDYKTTRINSIVL